MPERLPTGVRRLDSLLGGGVPGDAAVLLCGPAFMGKEILARRAILANLAAGRPAIVVTTNQTAAQVRHDLAAIDPGYDAAERKGLIHFVDTYSIPVGAEDGMKGAHYLDGPLDLNGVSVAVNRIQRDLVSEHEQHLIVVDSISTIIAHGNAQTAFRFLQTFVGRTRLVGAVNMVLMDEGMHSDAELQMFKHIMNGIVALRNQNGKNQIVVQGLGTGTAGNWVEYRFDEKDFEITGSFAAGRIR